MPASHGRAVVGSTSVVIDGPLPLPTLPENLNNTVYADGAIGVSIITGSARVTAHRMFEVMGWQAGRRIGFTTDGRVITIGAATSGRKKGTLGPRGQFRLPAELRHVTDISPGDYLLIAALPRRGVVAIVPLPVVFRALAVELSIVEDDR